MAAFLLKAAWLVNRAGWSTPRSAWRFVRRKRRKAVVRRCERRRVWVSTDL